MIDKRKNTTKYYFNGRLYRKGRLVLAAVTYYASSNQIESLEMLKLIFPKKLHSYFAVVEDIDIAKKNFPTRYFIKEKEVGHTLDGKKFVVCNQWGIDNINPLIEHFETLGLNIKVLDVFNKKGDRYSTVFEAIGREITKVRNGEYHVSFKKD